MGSLTLLIVLPKTPPLPLSPSFSRQCPSLFLELEQSPQSLEGRTHLGDRKGHPRREGPLGRERSTQGKEGHLGGGGSVWRRKGVGVGDQGREEEASAEGLGEEGTLGKVRKALRVRMGIQKRKRALSGGGVPRKRRSFLEGEDMDEGGVSQP